MANAYVQARNSDARILVIQAGGRNFQFLPGGVSRHDFDLAAPGDAKAFDSLRAQLESPTHSIKFWLDQGVLADLRIDGPENAEQKKRAAAAKAAKAKEEAEAEQKKRAAAKEGGGS